MKDMMEEVIGEVEVELDGRFSSMRTKETNLGKCGFSLYLLITIMNIATYKARVEGQLADLDERVLLSMHSLIVWHICLHFASLYLYIVKIQLFLLLMQTSFS